MKNIYQNYKKSTITAVVLFATVLCYTLFGFFGVPWILKDVVPKFLDDKNATLAIKDVKFNPYKFELNATGITLNTYSEIFSVDAIDLELKFREIFKKNINVEILRLKRPFINIEREKDLSFNFTPLIDANATEQKDENKESFFNFTLNSFEIVKGGASYTDKSLDKPFEVSLKDISYEINGINLKEYTAGKHKLGTDSTLLDNFDWNGGVRLDPLNIYGRIKFDGLKLGKIWQSYVNSGDLNVTNGFLDLDLEYSVKFKDTGFKLNIVDSNITARELLMRNDTNVISLNKAGVNGVTLTLFDDGNLSSQGEISLINLDNFNLDNQFILGLENANVKNINYELNNTLNAKIDEFDIKNLNLNDSEILLNLAKFNIMNPSLNIKLNTSDISLDIPKITGADIGVNTGKDKFINLNEASANGLKFDGKMVNVVELILDKLDIFSANNIFAGFKTVNFSGLNYDTTKTALNLENVKIDTPFFNSKIDEKGSKEINNLAILKMQNKAKKVETNSTKSNFIADVKILEILNANLAITQDFIGKRLKHKIKLNSKIDGLSSDFTKPFNLTANISTDEKIDINLKGKTALEPMNMKLDVTASATDLSRVNEIVTHYLDGFVSSGKLEFKGKLKFNKEIKVNGSLALKNFGLNDNNKSLVASVDLLNFKKIEYSPKGLLLENVELNNPYIKASISEDKSLNLARLIKDNNTTKEPVAQSETKKDDFNLWVKNFILNNASVDFSDASLVMPFLLKIKKLNAKVNNIQNDVISEINSNGVVGDGGSANIDMRLNVFDLKNFSDISLKFKDIELNDVTPYSATFVGRKIDSGTLDLSLIYKIENSKLKGDNDIKIDTIKLGEEVQSPDAMSLPLSLAISILQDSNNVINLNLPVSGDVSDPQFSYGGIVFKAVMQIFTDVVTSPFRLLGKVLGIANSSELASIDFTAGNADIMESQTKKIGEFKKITDSKKDIYIVITPAYDDAVDRFVLQKRLLDRDVAMTANKSGVSESDVIKSMSKKAFKTMPSDPYEALIKARKFSPTALNELAKSRAENLKETMITAGIPEGQIRIKDKTEKTKAQMNLYVPLPMGIEKR